MGVTGGVHGYEKSGVQGALLLLKRLAKVDSSSTSHPNDVPFDADKYLNRFNFVVFPSLCPWGYEYIQRMTPTSQDANRFWNLQEVRRAASLSTSTSTSTNNADA